MGLLGGFLGGLLGGDSGSSSMSSGGIGNSASTNSNHDEQFEVGVSTSGGGNATFNRDERSYDLTITGDGNTMTDFGAVSDSLALAMRGVEQANETARAANTSAGSIIAGVLDMTAKRDEEFTTALERVKTADVRVMIVAALAVVGVVAFSIYRKG